MLLQQRDDVHELDRQWLCPPSPAQPTNLSSTLESALQVLAGLQARPWQELEDGWYAPGLPKATSAAGVGWLHS